MWVSILHSLTHNMERFCGLFKIAFFLNSSDETFKVIPLSVMLSFLTYLEGQNQKTGFIVYYWLTALKDKINSRWTVSSVWLIGFAICRCYYCIKESMCIWWDVVARLRYNNSLNTLASLIKTIRQVIRAISVI